MEGPMFNGGILARIHKSNSKQVIANIKLKAEQRQLDRRSSAYEFLKVMTAFDGYYKQEEKAYNELHGEKHVIRKWQNTKGAYAELMSLMDKKVEREKEKNEDMLDTLGKY